MFHLLTRSVCIRCIGCIQCKEFWQINIKNLNSMLRIGQSKNVGKTDLIDLYGFYPFIPTRSNPATWSIKSNFQAKSAPQVSPTWYRIKRMKVQKGLYSTVLHVLYCTVQSYVYCAVLYSPTWYRIKKMKVQKRLYSIFTLSVSLYII